MSVPPDQLMDLMRKQAPAGGKTAAPLPVPAEPGISDASTSPMSAPMSTPEPKMGNREGALVNISMAMDLLEQALPALGSESDDGQKLLGAIRSLTGVIGQRKAKTNELQSTEIMNLLQSLPQAGGATPEGKAMASAPPIPNMPMPGAGGGMTPQGVGGSVPPSPM